MAPAGWLVLGGNTGVTLNNVPQFAIMLVLVAMLSATGGLALGCSVDQTHIGLLFSLVLAPMIMFGCTYYPWSALSGFPIGTEDRATQPARLRQRRVSAAR
ncbi:MAG: hypothetical protein HY820_07140 [Acidobacteria bacterium]|nr:hypothetical protein [Acidobacteriota bacterium]